MNLFFLDIADDGLNGVEMFDLYIIYVRFFINYYKRIVAFVISLNCPLINKFLLIIYFN